MSSNGRECLLFSRVSPGMQHSPFPISAVGFTDGSVVLTKGDITRDRHSKSQILHEGSYPITGLAFRQSGKTTHLFVATTENIQVICLVDHQGCVCVSCPAPSQFLSCSCGFPSFIVSSSLWTLQCYTLSVKDYPKLELDTRGCGLRCSTLSDPSQDLQFIVAGDECVYLYQPDERGPCFAFEGQKLIAHWYRGYLVIVSKERKPSPK